MAERMAELLQGMQSTNKLLKSGSCAAAMNAWSAFSASAREDGTLAGKYKSLIGLAIGLSKRCAPCVAYHTKAAISHGATEDEVLEAAFVAVLMEGGPAQAHLGLVLEALKEFGKCP